MSDATETLLDELAAHVAMTVEWVKDETQDINGRTSGSWDTEWMRALLSAGPCPEGNYEWSAWGWGSPCPEGIAASLKDAKAAACRACAESFLRAASAAGVEVVGVGR